MNPFFYSIHTCVTTPYGVSIRIFARDGDSPLGTPFRLIFGKSPASTAEMGRVEQRDIVATAVFSRSISSREWHRKLEEETDECRVRTGTKDGGVEQGTEFKQPTLLRKGMT